MKKLQYLFMVAICASLAGCADNQVEDDIEIVDEVFKDGNIYEADDKVLDDEIQNDEMAFSYENLGGIEFCFSSGAGAWSTIMTIGEDGSFKGMYSDSDMGDVGDAYPDGTRYCCNFKGQLSELTKIDERTYTAELIDISYENAVGEEEYADNVRYIYSDAYGLDDAETLYFYLPGTPKENLSEECQSLYTEMAEYNEYQRNWFEKKKKEMRSISEYISFIESIKKETFPVKLKFGLEVCYSPEHEKDIEKIKSLYSFDFLAAF